jgi:hypothetical protein
MTEPVSEPLELGFVALSRNRNLEIRSLVLPLLVAGLRGVSGLLS